jgi:hypothetical protein
MGKLSKRTRHCRAAGEASAVAVSTKAKLKKPLPNGIINSKVLLCLPCGVIKFHCIHGVTFLIDGYYGEDIDAPDEDSTAYDDFDPNDFMDESNIEAHLIDSIESLQVKLEKQLNRDQWQLILPKDGSDQAFYGRGNAPRTLRRKRLQKRQREDSASKLPKITTQFAVVPTITHDSNDDIGSDIEQNVAVATLRLRKYDEQSEAKMRDSIERLDQLVKVRNNHAIDVVERKTMTMFNKVQYICISAYLQFIVRDNLSKMEASAIR